MHPILASDFGNFGTFLIGMPALLFALLIGTLSVVLRFHPMAVVSGVVCMLAGTFFLLSLPTARNRDQAVTLGIGVAAVLAGLLLIFIRRKNNE